MMQNYLTSLLLLKPIYRKTKRLNLLSRGTKNGLKFFKLHPSIDGNFPNLKIVVEFVVCIPGYNTNVERIFSDVNNLWTDNKIRFYVKIVKAMLVVKHFFTENCS